MGNVNNCQKIKNYDLVKAIETSKYYYHYDLLTGLSGALCYIATCSDNSKDFDMIHARIMDGLQNSKKAIAISKGILGLGLSYLFCLKQPNVEGDANDLLEDLDKIIFRYATTLEVKENKDRDQAIEILVYLSLRLKFDFRTDEMRFFIEQTLISLINRTYKTLSFDFFLERFPYSILAVDSLFLESLVTMASHNKYEIRIQRIFEEICMRYVSVMPYMQVNRLRRLVTLLYASKYIPLGGRYKDYIEMLKANISLAEIFKNEVNGSNIFLKEGLGGVCLLAVLANRLIGNNLFNIQPKEILSMVNSSPYFDHIENDLSKIPIGINGLAGLKLLIDYLEHEKN